MSASFDDLNCISWCTLEDKQCSTCEKVFNAAIKLVEVINTSTTSDPASTMDKHALRDLYAQETGNQFPGDLAEYADWLEEKLTSADSAQSSVVEAWATIEGVREHIRRLQPSTAAAPDSDLVPCTTCGGACRIYSGSGGTNSYEPVVPYREQADSQKVETHRETIRCPQCGEVQGAYVRHTEPFWDWHHHCTGCGYIIQESEWDTGVVAGGGAMQEWEKVNETLAAIKKHMADCIQVDFPKVVEQPKGFMQHSDCPLFDHEYVDQVEDSDTGEIHGRIYFPLPNQQYLEVGYTM